MSQILKIEIRGQFVNFKIFRGQIIIYEKFKGSIYNFLEIYWGQIENFEDPNAKFERLLQWRILKFLPFRCHLKFSKFNLNKILHKFHHFENSSNYYPNNGIHLIVFFFNRQILLNAIPARCKVWTKHDTNGAAYRRYTP